MKRIIFITLIASLSLIMFSCGEKKASDKVEDTEMAKGKEFTSKYVCPMHCEGSGSTEMGTCPVCKMDYVLNEDYKAEGESHEGHDHEGHDHDGDDHSGHEH